MSDFSPIDPRRAKYRSLPPRGRYSSYGVTLLFLVASIAVSVFTHLSSDVERSDYFRFAPHAHRIKLSDELEQLTHRRNAISESLADPSEFNETLTEIDERIQHLETLIVHADHVKNPCHAIQHGEVWRLLTPCFLHYSYLHLVFNLFWFGFFASRIESYYGSLRFLGLLIPLILIPNLCQAITTSTNFGGLAAINFGLFGFSWLISKYKPNHPFQMEPHVYYVMLIWGLMGALQHSPHATAWAHGSGFVVGCSIGFMVAMRSGGAKHLRRRAEFKRSLLKQHSLHRCCVCGISDLDHPDEEFRVADDHHEYCSKHLPPH